MTATPLDNVKEGGGGGSKGEAIVGGCSWAGRGP